MGDGARVIVMASAPLAEGFALVGLEAVPDATPEQLEHLLEELFDSGQQALILVDSRLGRSGGKWLMQMRDASNRVVVVEIPGLQPPRDYRPQIADVMRDQLGPSAPEPGD
jgi:vacuolar-type H+-ATPase subunit F/Vma7